MWDCSTYKHAHIHTVESTTTNNSKHIVQLIGYTETWRGSRTLYSQGELLALAKGKVHSSDPAFALLEMFAKCWTIQTEKTSSKE